MIWSLHYLMAGLLLAVASPVHASDTGADYLARELKTLVEINSGSANAKGVDQIQAWIANQLKSMGFSVEIDANHLLVGERKGISSKVVTLIVHADTVFESNSSFQNFSKGEKDGLITGPGVIDDKGGIIVAIEGLRRYLKEGIPKITLRFISSPNEEAGSPGLTETFSQLSSDTWITLSFEPALDDGALIDSRRGDRWYHIVITGKEAHAGRAHKAGINACHALASKLSEISKLTNYDKDVTVSIGHMEGGKDKYNIVCGDAQAKIDTRFSTLPDRDKLHGQIIKILTKTDIAGTSVKFDLVDDCPPFAPSVNTGPPLKKYISLLQELEGKAISSRRSGGTADSNYFSNKEAIIIDGLGPVGGKMHTNEEFIVLSSLESRAEALHRFLLSLR